MIGMPDCFKMKTHPNLMKFKGRNVYLWIKAWNDLLLVVTEVVTALFNREREGKWGSAREKVPSVMLSMNQQSRQTNKRLVGFDTSWEHMISKWSLQKGGGVSGKRAEVFFCFFQLITCLLRKSPHVCRNSAYFVPLGHSFGGGWSSMVSLSIPRVVGMEDTESKLEGHQRDLFPCLLWLPHLYAHTAWDCITGYHVPWSRKNWTAVVIEQKSGTGL